MVYWHATKEHNSFWSNNEQVANRCIGNELYGSDSTNIEKGKASREKWALHLFQFFVFWVMSRYLTDEHSWCLALYHNIIDVILQLVSSTLHPIETSDLHGATNKQHSMYKQPHDGL